MTTYPFPIASHTYFNIKDSNQAYAHFLKDTRIAPVFTYSLEYTQEDILHRLGSVEKNSTAYKNLQLVLAGLKLRNENTLSTLEDFRLANEALFTPPSPVSAVLILQNIASKVTPETEDIWRYVTQKIAINDSLEHTATDKQKYEPVFYELKKYLSLYLQLETIDTSRSLEHIIQEVMNTVGLTDWKLQTVKGGTHASTQHKEKKIIIGERYMPRSDKAKLRIAVHEVCGHAKRGLQPNIEESEGFAIMLEQLIAAKFSYRRSFRYLAAALGWGVFKKPMDFIEVYEIIWRVMVVMGLYVEKDAKKYAFYEVARVFRGGRADVPGAVYIKDCVYFDANLRQWEALLATPPTYADFVEIIEGRKRVLQ